MDSTNLSLVRPAVGPADGCRFGVVSTFPPTECGIATFAAALCAGFIAAGASVDVVRVGPRPAVEDASVVARLPAGGRSSARAAIAALNAADVAIVQHEYGIYAGADGSSIVDVVRTLTVPTIVVAHTVVTNPTAGQRSVLVRLCDAADAIVAMTRTARDRLVGIYGVPRDKVLVIPHGAATPPAAGPEPDRPRDGVGRPRLLTWGLLGPGKGIEWAIDALARLRDCSPAPEYVVAGATHPKVAARTGESYRHLLQQRAHDAGVASMVTFDATYRALPALNTLIRSADVVVLPYDSKDQVTSGVLVDAVAAGRPVVSTAFPHAVELLGGGAGIVVPQRDPVALAGALRSVLSEPGRADAMAAEARRVAPELSWTAVAGRYAALAGALLDERRAAAAAAQA
ncbi:MAG: glycosyltransferase [Actinomycetota bacterium]|nr:glycosyltransferase [Actinomycetota bacterium]